MGSNLGTAHCRPNICWKSINILDLSPITHAGGHVSHSPHMNTPPLNTPQVLEWLRFEWCITSLLSKNKYHFLDSTNASTPCTWFSCLTFAQLLFANIIIIFFPTIDGIHSNNSIGLAALVKHHTIYSF